MAGAKQDLITIEKEVGLAVEPQSRIVVDTQKYDETHSSTASTVSGATSDFTSDSDSGASKTNKKKKAPEANDEPMKVDVRSWTNENHSEIQKALAMRKLEEELGESLQRMVAKLQDAHVAATMARYEQCALQEQQMYLSQPCFDPAFGYNHTGYQFSGSPLMPYLMAELANGAPPVPSYLPNYMDLNREAAQWHFPSNQGKPLPGKNAKRPVMTKEGDKGSKNTGAAETSGSDAAQKGDDICAAERTVVATKINRLGFSAERLLTEYFSQFGKIDNVCVPQKIKRVQGTSSAQSHLRPSGLGFIVMETEEDAKAILTAGADHTVCGKLINVRAFKRGQNENAAAVAED